MPCCRFVVSGHVQGVWFRASTRDRAQRLQLAGHAVNLADGSVEVVACGSDTALQELAAWLQHGPQQARVDHVVREDLPAQNLSGFSIG